MSLAVTQDGRFVYEPDGKVLTEYLWDRSKVAVIQGPIGSGTSTCSIHKIWLIANEQEPDYDGVRRTSWIVSRATYKELNTTILATTWPVWFPESFWGPMVRTEPMTHTLKREHFSGDGTTVECVVTFLALPDYETARKILPSFEITGFFVNEGQFTELGVVTELLGRCARWPSKKNGPGATWFGGFIDLNAPEEGHWIPYMRGDIPLPPDTPDEMKRQFKPKESWKFFVQPPGLIEKIVEGVPQYFPNPEAENQKWLAETYLEKIEGWDKADIDMRVLNKVGLSRSGKAVYPTFLAEDHVLKKDREANPAFPLVVGLDFGMQPAAVFCQYVGESWVVLSELTADNEPAEIFAPRVARHLAQKYPGMKADFWGDPRGGDGNQSVLATAYDIFMAKGMRIMEATTDNNVELRRSTVTAVLKRRYGLQINPSCLTLKAGLSGGYHYRKSKGTNGLYSERPVKNHFSHVVEALENALIGGGEGEGVRRVNNVVRLRPSPVARHKLRMGRD